MMPKPKIKTYKKFNDYYSDANALVRSSHDEFHAFRFRELGDNIVPHMGPFQTTYFQFAMGRILPAKVGVFDSHKVIEEYIMVIYLPGQILNWEKTGNWDGYVVNVRESFLNLQSITHLTESYGFLHRLQPLVFNLSSDDYQVLSNFYELMLMEQNEMKEENILVIRNLLQILIVYVNRIVSGMKTSGSFVELQYQKIAIRFKSLVFEHYQDNKSVSYYASLLGVSPAYLIDSVKKVYNTTPKRVINDIIFLHAKTLLTSTDTGIKELAWSLNFEDYTHFVKFFKKMSGITPAEFRKNRENRP
ncbi:MAG: AraC family transcriptional regulator [Cyclobacteriaceae bacterium]|nr:AraC family transcriptional regulator [Cyclobacteriaceae bacterium]